MGVLDKFLDIMKLSDDDDYDVTISSMMITMMITMKNQRKRVSSVVIKRIMILMKMKNMMITMSFRQKHPEVLVPAIK